MQRALAIEESCNNLWRIGLAAKLLVEFTESKILVLSPLNFLTKLLRKDVLIVILLPLPALVRALLSYEKCVNCALLGYMKKSS